MKILYKKHILLFIILGITFNTIEYLIRIPANQLNGLIVGDMELSFLSLTGYTSLYMLVIGGISGIILGKLNCWRWSKHLPMFLQSLIGTIIILSLEYGSGMILNNYLHLGIWDYSNEFLNLHGQICLKLGIFFYLLNPFAYWLEDYLQYAIYNEEKPITLFEYYKWFFRGL